MKKSFVNKLIERILSDDRILVDAWTRGNLVISSSSGLCGEKRRFLAPVLQGFSANHYGWRMLLRSSGGEVILKYHPQDGVKAFIGDDTFIISSEEDIETLVSSFGKATKVA